MESAIRRFSPGEFRKLEKQHNIMVIVGNGFDLSILSEFESIQSTSYTAFFYYLKSVYFDSNNFFMKKMEEARRKHEESVDKSEGKFSDWSDFESLIAKIFKSREKRGRGLSEVEIIKLKNDLDDIRNKFSQYLNSIVSPELLGQIDSDVEELRWGYRSLASFLGDLPEGEYKRMSFPSEICHYDLFNYNILNLNFTPFLDNYLYLDHAQFLPRLYKTSDTNFLFRINPNGYENDHFSGEECQRRWKKMVPPGASSFMPDGETEFSTYIYTEIFHPHGMQSVPRSLLFGAANLIKDELDPVRCLEKPFLSRSRIRYEKMIAESRLFIVFGCSLGQSDAWWWERVLSAVDKGAEMIVYWYVEASSTNLQGESEKVKECFIDKFFVRNEGCGKTGKRDNYDRVWKRVFFVPYSDSCSLSFLGFNPKMYKVAFKP